MGLAFITSAPSNNRASTSGFKAFKFDGNRLSVIKHYKDNNHSDIDINVQQFCYLKSSISNNPDFMIFAKSNGYIEIVKDFNFKIINKLPVDPNYVLKCVPEDFNSAFCADCLFANVDYKNGLLYCAMCSGRIYIFILNLNSSYYKFEKFISYSNYNQYYDSLKKFNNNINNKITLSNDDKDFLNTIEYVPNKEITHFLLPLESNHLENTPFLSLSNDYYKNIPIYRTSMYTFLNHSINNFKINDLNPLSFLINKPNGIISIRKCTIPLLYNKFLQSSIKIKIDVLKQNKFDNSFNHCIKNGEIISWDKLAKEMGYSSVFNWFISDKDHFNTLNRNGSVTWDDLARRDGTGILNSILVWQQRTNYTCISNNILKSLNSVIDTNNNDNSIILNENNNLLNYKVFSNENISTIIDDFNNNTNNSRASPTCDSDVSSTPDFDNQNIHTFSHQIPQLRRSSAIHNRDLHRIIHRSNSQLFDKIDLPRLELDLKHIKQKHFISDLTPIITFNNSILYDNDEDYILQQFLPKEYSHLSILSIDKFKTLSTFNQISHLNQEEKFNFNIVSPNETIPTSLINATPQEYSKYLQNENIKFQMALSTITSFDKIFHSNLTPNIIYVLTSFGLLFLNNDLLDPNNTNILNMSKQAIKFAPSMIGIINDGILVVNRKTEDTCELTLIVSCIPAEIKAFTVTFYYDSKIGDMEFCDSLRLTKPGIALDKMALFDIAN